MNWILLTLGIIILTLGIIIIIGIIWIIIKISNTSINKKLHLQEIERNKNDHSKEIERNKKDHSEETESYQKKIEDLNEKLTMSTHSPTQIGKEGERQAMDLLKSGFPNDDFIKPNASKGEADILQTIKHNGEKIGKIYYEVKNKKNWLRADFDKFIEQVIRTEYQCNIFVTNSLPKKEMENSLMRLAPNFFYDE